MSTPYSYETGKTSASVNWKTGAGNGRKVTGITVHHWGDTRGLDYDGIVNFLCSPRPANPTSAHYVAQGRDGKGNISARVACIVDPDDIAYACGTWAANLSQISIECRPECSPEDREVVAQLIARLRSTYGPLPLVGHQHWVPDACPGDAWMAALSWLDSRAKQIAAGTTPAPAPTPAPIAPPEDIVATKDELSQLLDQKLAKILNDGDGQTIRNDVGYARDQIRAELRAQVAGLSTAIQALAAGKPVDLDAVTAAAKAGAQAALDEKIASADVSLNVTP